MAIKSQSSRANSATDERNPEPRRPWIAGLHGWGEFAKNVVEILAIVASGVWAYTRYFAGEAPSLEARAAVTTNVSWRGSQASGHCVAQLGVRVKNIGKTSFKLNEISLSTWQVDYKLPSPTTITRFDPEATMRSSKPTFSEKIVQGSVLGEYGPDVEWLDDYILTVPIDPARTPDASEAELVIFRFVAVGTDSDGDPVRFEDWRWTANCETVGNESQMQVQQAQEQSPGR